jgi:hypothetical protein
MIASEDRYKTTFIYDWGVFVWVVIPFGLKNAPPTYQIVVSMDFKEYLGIFMKLFMDDFTISSDQNTHLQKLHLCFDKCRKFNISLNSDKCMFLVFSVVI